MVYAVLHGDYLLADDEEHDPVKFIQLVVEFSYSYHTGVDAESDEVSEI